MRKQATTISTPNQVVEIELRALRLPTPITHFLHAKAVTLKYLFASGQSHPNSPEMHKFVTELQQAFQQCPTSWQGLAHK